MDRQIRLVVFSFAVVFSAGVYLFFELESPADSAGTYVQYAASVILGVVLGYHHDANRIKVQRTSY